MKKLLLVLSVLSLATMAFADDFEDARVNKVSGMGPFQVKQCDDKDVIQRVCGEGGMLTPITRDPSGVGLTFQDLAYNQQQRIKASKDLEKITPEGFAVFKKSFEIVMAEYKNLAGTLPMAQQQHVLERLAQFKVISREEMQAFFDNPVIRIQMKPATTVNAFYLPQAKTIYFFPAITNQPKLSMAAFTMVLAHEMGHHMDPEVEAYLPGQAGQNKLSRNELFGNAGVGCWQKSFGSYKPTAEDWADWLGSMVMNRVIARYSKELSQLRYAQNTMKLFCLNLNAKKSVVDPHAAPRDRILWVMRQPSLYKSINCSGTPTYASQGAAPACSLDGQVTY